VAYSPLGSQHEIPITKERITTNLELNSLATKRGYSLAQILIAWGLKRSYGVLPKSSSAERIRSNLELVDLSDEDFEELNRITEGRNHRFCDLEWLFGYDAWGGDQ
jgi:diketogulonate reductase-like aldo/keto reductase